MVVDYEHTKLSKIVSGGSYDFVHQREKMMDERQSQPQDTKEKQDALIAALWQKVSEASPRKREGSVPWLR